MIEINKIAPTVVFALLAACGTAPSGGAPTKKPSNPAPIRLAGEISSQEEPDAPADPSPDPPTTELIAAPEETAPRLKIALEPDQEFISAGHPAAGTAGYHKWKTRKSIRVGQSHLSTADLSPNEGHVLVMSGMESAVRIYTRAGALVGRHVIAGEPEGGVLRSDAAFWPTETDDELRYVVGTERGLFLYDGMTGDLLKQLSEIPCWEMRWSPDGRYLLTVVSEIGSQTSEMSFYAAREGGLNLLKTAAFDERVDGWDLSDDNRYLVVTHYPSNQAELWDLSDGSSRWRTGMPRFGGAVDISPDGELVAVGGNELRIMRLRDPTVRSVYTDFGNNVARVAFSPSSDALAVSSYDGRIRILAADATRQEPKLIKTLRHGGTANVYSLVFTRDGENLLSSSGDKTARIWGR